MIPVLVAVGLSSWSVKIALFFITISAGERHLKNLVSCFRLIFLIYSGKGVTHVNLEVNTIGSFAGNPSNFLYCL